MKDHLEYLEKYLAHLFHYYILEVLGLNFWFLWQGSSRDFQCAASIGNSVAEEFHIVKFTKSSTELLEDAV